jgi:hypothetical protein
MTYEEVEVWIHVSLTSALDGSDCELHALAASLPKQSNPDCSVAQPVV